MRRLCEKPGCGQPVAVIYGLAPSGTEPMMWIDSWSPERIRDVTPPGARGVLCVRHGEMVSAPRGWVLEDRREAIPRLFKPRQRGNLVAVPDSTADNVARPKRDNTGALKRSHTRDIPRPQLFVDLLGKDEPVAVETVAVVVEKTPVVPVVEPSPVVVEPTAVEPTAVEPDDSTEILIRQDDSHRGTSTFDPDEDFAEVREPTGSMLRDAFRPRFDDRRDPTSELFRSTQSSEE
ncbi:unannotated protein [freshwater metagenome]|uniref:Unannotated protein n=1 Tax=freshwater metagenome TaxID=449393 RepID=A0A6J7W247_9ZZZZ|nr:hypothetical protein [Actinomycetota bacterium]